MPGRQEFGFKGGFHDFWLASRVAEGFGLRWHGCQRSKRGMIFETGRGVYEIFPLPYPPAEYHFIATAVEFLRRGFPYLPRIGTSPTGELTVTVAGTPYGLREWIAGRPVDFEDPCRLAQVVEAMAVFHRAGEGFRPASCPEGRKTRPWPERLREDLADLYTWEGSLRAEGSYGLAPLHAYFPSILAAAVGAVEELARLPYEEIRKEAEARGGISHGNYGDESLVLTATGEVAVVDFDRLALGTRLDDLGDFLFRYGGLDPDRALFILQIYQRIFPLTREEVECLLAYLRFPHHCYELMAAYFGGAGGGRNLRRAVEELARRQEVLAVLHQAVEEVLVAIPVYPAPQETSSGGEGDLLPVSSGLLPEEKTAATLEEDPEDGLREEGLSLADPPSLLQDVSSREKETEPGRTPSPAALPPEPVLPVATAATMAAEDGPPKRLVWRPFPPPPERKGGARPTGTLRPPF